MTFESERDEIPWTLWIEDETPLPTPVNGSFPAYENVVGLFEGARYSDTPGMYDQPIYRPKYTCKMRELSVPFCPICAEAMIGGVHERTYLSDLGPDTIEESVSSGESIWLDPQAKSPDPDAISTTWIIDGEEVQNTGAFEFVADRYESGRHIVDVELYDRTSLMRNSLFSDVSRQKIRWAITVEGSTSEVDGDTDEDFSEFSEDSDTSEEITEAESSLPGDFDEIAEFEWEFSGEDTGEDREDGKKSGSSGCRTSGIGLQGLIFIAGLACWFGRRRLRRERNAG